MAKCKMCKKKFVPKFNSMQITCNEMDCAVAYARSVTGARWKKECDDNKKMHKDLKKKVKADDIEHQKSLTQDVFNRMRVLEEKIWFQDRGIEPYCISCGKTHMDWCCGHYKSRGAQAILRYDRSNTFLQCNNYCNKNLSGNIAGNKNTIGYIKGLLLRFGDKEGQTILDYCETMNEPRSYDTPWLKQFRKECAAKTRQLETMLQ